MRAECQVVGPVGSAHYVVWTVGSHPLLTRGSNLRRNAENNTSLPVVVNPGRKGSTKCVLFVNQKSLATGEEAWYSDWL